MKIIYREAFVDKKELSPEYFENFNWNHFLFGDVVWLEDNEETNKPAAHFLGIHDNAVQLRGISYQIAYRDQRIR